jgi:hypothetical protein
LKEPKLGPSGGFVYQAVEICWCAFGFGALFRGFGGSGSLMRPQKPVLAGSIRPEGG